LLGILYTSVAFGSLLGPKLAGVAFDVSKSYNLPIIASAVACVIAIGCIAVTAKPAKL
jgi:hypothetical protein